MSATETRRQFSVIGRLRRGEPCTTGPFSIIMEIRNQLQHYQNLFSVSFTPPNYIIHSRTVELQLHLLSSQTLSGSGFILHILPWCPEYESYDLPWVLNRIKAGTPLGPKNVYINNLVGQPEALQHHVSFIITSHTHTEDLAPAKINIDGLLKTPQLLRQNTTHLQINQPVSYQQTGPDFSYLMILELKQFYYAKYAASRKCIQCCEQICDVPYQLYTELETDVQCISEQAQSLDDTIDEQHLFNISTFAAEARHETVYAAEDLVGIQYNMARTC